MSDVAFWGPGDDPALGGFKDALRTEWLRAAGFDQTELAERHGVAFVVPALSLEYMKPARFNDSTCNT